MNNDDKQEVRSKSDIVVELESLNQERGYNYSYCRMIDEYLWLKPGDL